MSSQEVMYDLPSGIIAAVLLLSMIAAIYAGLSIGQAARRRRDEEAKAQTLTVQGSLLGILGLLLGFTFSLALSRYDMRSQAVVGEANAIGTAWLRTDLLADEPRAEARALLHRYAIVRAEAGRVPASQEDRREVLIAAASEIFGKLWIVAAHEARTEGGPVVMGFVTSLNDMIDELSVRNAAIERHVPELVLFALYGTIVLVGGVVGLGSAQAGVRPGPPVYAMVALIVVLVFLIIDLDRPRRGLIEVDQSPLLDLAASLDPTT